MVAVEVSGNISPAGLTHSEGCMLTPAASEVARTVARMSLRYVDEFGLFR